MDGQMAGYGFFNILQLSTSLSGIYNLEQSAVNWRKWEEFDIFRLYLFKNCIWHKHSKTPFKIISKSLCIVMPHEVCLHN